MRSHYSATKREIAARNTSSPTHEMNCTPSITFSFSTPLYPPELYTPFHLPQEVKIFTRAVPLETSSVVREYYILYPPSSLSSVPLFLYKLTMCNKNNIWNRSSKQSKESKSRVTLIYVRDLWILFHTSSTLMEKFSNETDFIWDLFWYNDGRCARWYYWHSDSKWTAIPQCHSTLFIPTWTRNWSLEWSYVSLIFSMKKKRAPESEQTGALIILMRHTFIILA